jgi:cytochrome c2
MGGDVGRGAHAIGSYGCGSCHVIPGIAGATGTAGPEQLVGWIMNPQATEPRTVMPNLGVRAADSRDIAAYLYTLR